jgi:hypothetical protein
LYSFIPKSNEGAKDPKWKDNVCYGWNLTLSEESTPIKIQLKWLLQAYQLFPDKENFFP